MENTIESRKPKVWKMLLISWIYAFVVINVTFAIMGPFLVNLYPLVRSMIITTILVPAMGLGLPKVHQKLSRWTTM